jgi:hypothetical protein
VRILIASALLFATASCAWAPPPAMVAAPPRSPPPPVALVAPPPPTMVAPAPVPPPQVAVAAPAPAPFLFAPLAGLFWPPPAGRLTLSNFSFDTAHVEAVVTAAPDCTVREGTTASDFVLPLNGTRIIESVPGADVCWRRAIDPRTAAGAPPSTPGWTEWSRAFLSSGRSVDARL